MSAHSIPSTMDLISHAMIHHGVCVHFHLAGSINADTDIPLVPPLKHHNFRIFWLNNKEMFFTQQAEHIFQQICKSGIDRDETTENIPEGIKLLVSSLCALNPILGNFAGITGAQFVGCGRLYCI